MDINSDQVSQNVDQNEENVSRNNSSVAKMYVGNLPYDVTVDALRDLFSQAGSVVDAVIISDKFSGRSKGFGFITMGSKEEMDKAIEMFSGYNLETDRGSRALVVNEARPQEDRPRFGGGDRGRGGFGGGRSQGFGGGYGQDRRGGFGGNRGGRGGFSRDNRGGGSRYNRD